MLFYFHPSGASKTKKDESLIDHLKLGIVIDEAKHVAGFVNPWFSFFLCPFPDGGEEFPQRI
jgi:hypothetical protein